MSVQQLNTLLNKITWILEMCERVWAGARWKKYQLWYVFCQLIYLESEMGVDLVLQVLEVQCLPGKKPEVSMVTINAELACGHAGLCSRDTTVHCAHLEFRTTESSALVLSSPHWHSCMKIPIFSVLECWNNELLIQEHSCCCVMKHSVHVTQQTGTSIRLYLVSFHGTWP